MTALPKPETSLHEPRLRLLPEKQARAVAEIQQEIARGVAVVERLQHAAMTSDRQAMRRTLREIGVDPQMRVCKKDVAHILARALVRHVREDYKGI